MSFLAAARSLANCSCSAASSLDLKTFNAAALEGLLCKTGFIMTQGVLVKRALFIKAGMFNPELIYSDESDL